MEHQPAKNAPTLVSRTAQESIGFDDGEFRIKGGRSYYEAVLYNDHNGGSKVKLARLESVKCADGEFRLREVSRYVDPDTVLEFVSLTPSAKHFFNYIDS